MPIHSVAIDRANAIAAWLRGLSVSPAKGFAYGVLFMAMFVIAALPLVLGGFVWAFVLPVAVAAVFLYNFRK